MVFVGSPEATAKAHAIELGGADALFCGEAYEYPACCAARTFLFQDGTPWVVPFLREIEPATLFPLAGEQAREPVPSSVDDHPRLLPLLHSLPLHGSAYSGPSNYLSMPDSMTLGTELLGDATAVARPWRMDLPVRNPGAATQGRARPCRPGLLCIPLRSTPRAAAPLHHEPRGGARRGRTRRQRGRWRSGRRVVADGPLLRFSSGVRVCRESRAAGRWGRRATSAGLGGTWTPLPRLFSRYPNADSVVSVSRREHLFKSDRRGLRWATCYHIVGEGSFRSLAEDGRRLTVCLSERARTGVPGRRLPRLCCAGWADRPARVRLARFRAARAVASRGTFQVPGICLPCSCHSRHGPRRPDAGAADHLLLAPGAIAAP